MTTATLINEVSAATVITEPSSPADKRWHAMMEQIEFGDYNDNLSVFLTMRYAMRKGHRYEGLQVIKALRTKIVESAESKSSKWLLPELNACLQPFD